MRKCPTCHGEVLLDGKSPTRLSDTCFCCGKSEHPGKSKHPGMLRLAATGGFVPCPYCQPAWAADWMATRAAEVAQWSCRACGRACYCDGNGRRPGLRDSEGPFPHGRKS